MTISWLIDSNVLVYAFFHKAEEQNRREPDSKLRRDSRRVMTLAAEGELSTAVAQQNLLEFLAVVTSPKRVAAPVSLTEALEAYLSFCSANAQAKHFFDFSSIDREAVRRTRASI